MTTRPLSLRLLLLGLLLLFGLLQIRLWFSDDGWGELFRLQHGVAEQQTQNRQLTERNARLEAEVNDLKQGEMALEERARSDLGMVREDESFFLLVTQPEVSTRKD